MNPDYFQHEEYQNRLKSLEEIRALGIDPYPPKYPTTRKTSELQVEWEGKEPGHFDDAAAGTTPHLFVSGRLVLFRPMGKNAFATVQDETGRIQIVFNRDHTHVAGLPADQMPLKFLEKRIDLGDILGVEGHLFRTQKGELTLFAKTVTLLSKSLLPLPDKHAGVADKGVLYRKRWLDLITNADSMERFRLRSRILFAIRKYMNDWNFEEVETPILQNIYGGAEARPFTTHLNALDQNMFLRISLEISLKKLVIGGMQRVFEIGKIFRNEGIDRTHNPEFTMMEAYASGWDYFDMMAFTEQLFEAVALNLLGTTQLPVTRDGVEHTIELKAPWRRLSMVDAVRQYAKVDPLKASMDELRTVLLERKTLDPKEVHGASRGSLTAMLFEEFAEAHLIQPHHIIDHPIETTPLCKPHRDPELRRLGFVERFESFVLGSEMCNSYTELNDPIFQRHLFEEQAKRKDAGDDEAHPFDEEFLEALSQGMPPTGGVGIGIDRLVMLFTAAPSIRDILFFPLMRPED